ncbi:TadA family conjugal transfer-associated ATPase [Arcanobacterium pinnipediorum]|uniref:TadA family conjugal transfer-associated ATPase n=1 Tax=Arcanobacterium pinnipediorum TaxID=1503041 RepID=A0ABY5AH41_9ACTO|nr:TadA family conjugal transfer-associated ATPase [Arcanobacterium pinnipediorum]USR79315.1 TadA family conjugal transfer-associated ATPase [Arcanobacterium pinnipediorum]
MAFLPAEQIAAIRRRLASGTTPAGAINAQRGLLTNIDIANVDAQVRHEVTGAGLTIGPLLEDPSVTDVVVNGPGQVWADRGQGMVAVPIVEGDQSVRSAGAVRALAVRLAALCGQRLDDSSPIVDGTFASGVRLHAVIAPLSASGTLISLRTHRARVFSLEELAQLGGLKPSLVPLVHALVEKRANVIISGATGAGKTTFLNAVLSRVAGTERILIIEESAELAPQHPHVLHLQVRRANVQGAGEVTMSDLVRAAMRMRPDRIILGECRGPEVRDVLGALNTGHEGGWATIHANSAQDVPARLVALGALANMSETTVGAQVASALDAVIHLERVGAWRGITQIATFDRVRGELVARVAVDIGRNGIEYGPSFPELCQRLELPCSSL